MKEKETEVSRVCPSSSSSSPILRHCYSPLPRSIGEHRFGGKTYKPLPLQQPSIIPFWSQRLQQTLTACVRGYVGGLPSFPSPLLPPSANFLSPLPLLPPLLLALPSQFPNVSFFLSAPPSFFCGFLAVWGPAFHLASDQR